MEIALDARPIFDPSDGARELDVEIGEMTLSQSIQVMHPAALTVQVHVGECSSTRALLR